MSVIEEYVALQLPGTLMERLQQLIGQPVLVYLSGVHVHLMGGLPHSAPGGYSEVSVLSWPCPRPGRPCPPGPGPGPGPCPPWPPLPPPEPGPCPGPAMMGTAVVAGTLAFAGADYLALNAPLEGACREVLIPYTAVGMIVVGGTVV